MSVPRDMTRHTDPELDRSGIPSTQSRRRASHSDLGEPRLGGGDPVPSGVTGGDEQIMRSHVRLAAQSGWPALAGWRYSAARAAPTLQRRDAAFLLGSFVLVLALVLVATALVLGPVLSLYSHAYPGRPAASGPPIATSSPTATAPTTSATFVARDTTTRGNWKGVYGSTGYIIAGDTQQLPASIRVTSTRATPYTWATSTADVRALARPDHPTGRVAGSWYSHSSFTFDITITDGRAYQLALYVLDWGHWNLVETASIVDARSGRVLDTQHVSSFGNGEYVVWRVSGHLTLQIANNSTGPNNAVVSGLFFAPVGSA